MSFFRRHPHLDDEDDQISLDGSIIDPELRLRTVRTAASAVAESIRSESRRENRRRTRNKSIMRKGTLGRAFFNREKKRVTEDDPRDKPTVPEQASAIKGARRNIHVNVPMPPAALDRNGEPIARYPRNKVRTSKYTLVSFLPKNLSEQFRRIANVYFLALVILAVFPAFGATTPQISMLPLVFIITVTAAKDGVEDYRRASLDDQVNNSAATVLGSFFNPNQRHDRRSWLSRVLNIGPSPGTVTRGVRRLRAKEASDSNPLSRDRDELVDDNMAAASNFDRVTSAPSLDDIRSVGSAELERPGSFTYPPPSQNDQQLSTILNGSNPLIASSQYALSTRSLKSDGVVDYSQQRSGTARWERTLWKKLEVGDIVLLRDNDQIPADIVVLSTSDANGLCYVETKNLDGETNLKPRKALKATSSILSEEDIEHASFVLDAEPPHPNLYSFNGVLKFKSPPSAVDHTVASVTEKLEPVTINELLLRGCAVRNTKWIIGLVVFTGADSKIMLNGGETPSKRSKIEKETNFNVLMNFLLLIALCLIAAIANGFYYAQTNTSGDWFYETNAATSTIPVVNALITFGSCLISLQNIVPISLYISIEIVKTIQAYFISQDLEMFYEPLDASCTAKTWNISDDLGQIEYIFSDKTGTLTQNIMEFQKCSINGVAYGDGVTEAMRGAAMRTGNSAFLSPADQELHLQQIKADMINTLNRTFKNRYAQHDHLTLISSKLAEDIANRDSTQRQHIIAFFRALAICHTVLAEKPEPRERPFELQYKAESPDESALVAAARDVGFPFVRRTNRVIEIEALGQLEQYEPLRVLEFNSTRKRASVIVRTPDGRIALYCKGADSVIYARLVEGHDQNLIASTTRDLEAFANGGLRTLCVAFRYLDEQQFLEWSHTYDTAAAAVKDREEKIEAACDLIEQNLTILGATALEDKLQEGVPEAIEILHQAGIKLWILTGDKVQTAIEIGFSCNLLKSDMEIMILAAESTEGARSQIEAGLNKIASIVGPPQVNKKGRANVNRSKGFAVVIDGETLRYALDPSLKPLFLTLGTQCDAVVCCRVSPAQKALTVKLVKDGCNAMTLAIGDGANDVAMIQEANIGCGLLGLEGSQAAMSADYAFGQFRFLSKLLLVHGRWSYTRVSDMHANFFYKNVIWTLALFWYGIFMNFDSTYLYQVTFILLYNVLFTSLPVIALGAFDQDINSQASLAFPRLYTRGILGLEYTRTKFWIYMADGLYQSVVVFFVPWAVWSNGTATASNGRGTDSLADFGTTVALAAITSANIFVGFSNRYWTVITWVVIVGSTIACPLWIAIYSQFESFDFRDEISVLFSTADTWFAVVLSVVIALAPRVICKAASQIYFPLDKDIVREAWVAGDLKSQLGIKHRYRKNHEVAEDAAFVEADNSTIDLGIQYGYSPIGNTPSALETPRASTPSIVPAQSTGQQPQLVAEATSHAERMISAPPSASFSTYSASDIPSSAHPWVSTPSLDRVNPSTNTPPHEPPHSSKSHPLDDGEYFLVRSGLSSPRTSGLEDPDDSRDRVIAPSA